MLPQSTHGTDPCSPFPCSPFPCSPFEVLAFPSIALGEAEDTVSILGQDGSRYTQLQVKSPSSMWISRSRKLKTSTSLCQCNKNMTPTKSMTPWSFLASYYSALHETCISIAIWLNSPRIESSQYLFLGSTLFSPLIYSFHKVHSSSNFEFNSF